MKNCKGKLPSGFVESIQDAAALLRMQHLDTEPSSGIAAIKPLPSLLEQCRDLVAESTAEKPEPIRTLHHFACTGGTLITKCLASMPNTQVLSEVNPLSPQVASREDLFFPSDIIRLAKASTRGADDDLLVRIFLGGLGPIYEDARSKGWRLLLRDHAHSSFCFGDDVSPQPTLNEIVARVFPVCSVVTVRHPLDSYLSLMNNGWRHFRPLTLGEYARRYHAFLDHYADKEVFHYEDFTVDPNETLRKMCDVMQLSFDESYYYTYTVHRLSGDSGRSGSVIEPRERRPLSDEMREEAGNTPEFAALCSRLDYELDI